MAGVSLVAALGAVLVLTRPQGPATVAERAREEAPAARVAGEPPPAVDDEHAYAPGSPGAVAERFLRAFWRAHYVDAAALSTGRRWPGVSATSARGPSCRRSTPSSTAG